MISIGLMSGTSMDGIDGAVLDTDGDGHIKPMGKHSKSYEPWFKTLLHGLQFCIKAHDGNVDTANQDYLHGGLKRYLDTVTMSYNLEKVYEDLVKIAKEKMEVDIISFDAVVNYSTKLHGEFVHELMKQNGLAAEDVSVIGCHGQTLYHKPAPNGEPNTGVSIIVNDGQYLANMTGVNVVNNFRKQDVDAGGQGAPFAPIYHKDLASQGELLPAVVINCGGIGNATVIPSDSINDLIGFDTGPGNGLLDQFVKIKTHNKECFDKDGQYGGKGTVNEAVLAELLTYGVQRHASENYFEKPAPKSLDYGDLKLLDSVKALSIENGCRTLAAFTAEAMVCGILAATDSPPTTWILAGGGWNNPVILEELKTRGEQKVAAHIQVEKAEYFCWDNQALEAQIFAYFAVRSLYNLPLSTPKTTGVPEPLSGGVHYVPQILHPVALL